MSTIDYASLGIASPSTYQVAIFEAVKKAVDALLLSSTIVGTASNIMIQAVAGSGKTSTIVAAAKLIPAHIPAAFFAFGKEIAEELKARLPAHFDCRTMNSLGGRIWSGYIKQKYNRGWPQVDPNKVNTIIRKVLKEIADRAAPAAKAVNDFGFLFADIKFLVEQAKANGVVPAGVADARDANGASDTEDFWFGILNHFGRQVEDVRPGADSDGYEITLRAIEITREVLRRNLADEMTIDFNDQLYMPVVKRTTYGTTIPCKKLKIVMIDETQDLNPIQRSLIGRVLDKGGLLVAVGDEKQAIYGFRGADNESMYKIRTEFNCTTLPLSISYRCARTIVEHAQQVNPEIQAAPNAKEGLVEYLAGYQSSFFQPEDLVICRNNAPLISLAYNLIKSRVRCKVLGRDIGASLTSLIDKLDHGNSVSKLGTALSDWYDAQVQAITDADPDKDNSDAIQRVADKYDSIMVFVNETVSKTVIELKREIEAMFAEEKDAVRNGFVILCTGHKSKGLESTRVFHLDSHLLYPKFVQPGTWQFQQEANLDYVCRTRAKDALYYIRSDMFGKGKTDLPEGVDDLAIAA